MFSKDTSEQARAAGRKGGLKTKQRLEQDPHYFSRIGSIGGEAVKNTLGLDHYRKIGKMSKKEQQS